jgi:MFS family permease
MSAPTESVLAARPRLTGHRAFALYWCARTATAGAYQMQAVAIGWQVYELTGSALDLGLVGLVQFVPIVVLSPLIGQAADHFDRRALARTCQIVKALVAGALAFATFTGLIGRDGILALLFVTGTARAFETPTLHALLPALVPAPLLPRAIAAAATANQTAIICGPALGGLLYALGATAVYGTCTVVFLAASILVSLLPRPPRQTGERQPVSFATVFAGFAYIREKPVLLGAVSLDLFAVLLGGVTALLPIYARDILATGPWGLGLLRSAPAVGALAIAVALARHGFERRIGAVLFGSVALFGVAGIVFALSTSLVLSLVALAVYGAADATSVVIRHSLVQTRTPNDMLGRVMAVNSMCTGTSGTLGEFRAGAVAAWLGVVPAVLIGGAGVIAVTFLWMRLFPALTRIRTLQEREA